MRRLALLLLLAGCAKNRAPAPDDMDGLVRYLFVHHDDPDALADGMENLSVWLDGEGSTETANEGYVLADFTAEEVEACGLDTAPGDVEDLIGVAVGWVSPHPIEDHAGLLVLEDQIWNDPSTYIDYTRVLLEGDAESFPPGPDGLVRTHNTIDKSGAFGVHIPYEMFKDYTWVPLADDRRAVVGRAWIEEASCAEGGKNCLNQTYSIDLFYAPTDGETVRLTATWNELVTSVDSALSEKQKVGLMVKGMNDIMQNTDDHLSGAR